MRYSEADIQEFINDNDVKFIKFSFCDVFGSQKIISVLPSVLPRAFAQGIAVDASSIEGFYKPGDSGLFLFPDTDAISLLPATATVRRSSSDAFPFIKRKSGSRPPSAHSAFGHSLLSGRIS